MNESIAQALAATAHAELTSDVIRATNAIYRPLHIGTPPIARTEFRDIAYGTDWRHRLDLAVPEGAGPPRPVFMFVHGGGFIGGDKTAPGSPFYGNIPLWAARSGYIGVNITYRLAPAHRYPAGADDVAAAVHWTRENIATYGGDPDSIVIMGHSAGATHVACCVARGEGGIAGVALMSGVYDFADFVKAGASANLEAYLGCNGAIFREVSPLGGLVESGLPILFGCAEFDPPSFQRQTVLLLDALFELKGTFPNVHFAAGHNHFSTVLHIGAQNTHDRIFSDRLSDFITSVHARRYGAISKGERH
jgi:pimeloyl-ACP methyl ester carboxylesterase